MAALFDIVETTPTLLAMVRCKAQQRDVPQALVAGLDKIYAVLRAHGARSGRNVAVYIDMTDGVVTFQAGVEIDARFEQQGEVVVSATPGGRAAHVVHIGDYASMAATTMAAMQAMIAQKLPVGGLNWEVYGEFEEDPAKRRVDIYFGLKGQGV